MATVCTAPPAQTVEALVQVIVLSVVPYPGVITAVPQFVLQVPPTVAEAEASLFKSNPPVARVAAASGIPLFPLALSAMGMVIMIFPPTGIVLTVVNVIAHAPD